MILIQPANTQPELPAMKNNDQRKNFLDCFRDWPIWFEVPEASETYYRYNLPDGSSIVICEYKTYRKWAEMYTDIDPEGTVQEEYLLQPGYRYLHDCRTNRSALVDYLKGIQKR